MIFLMTKTVYVVEFVLLCWTARSFGVDIGHTGRDDAQQLPGGIAGQQGH